MAKATNSTTTAIAATAEKTAYAAIGLGELFTERTRALAEAAGRIQAQVTRELKSARGTSVHEATSSVRTASGKALNAGLARAEQAQTEFAALAERGHKVVADILARPEVKQAATRLDSTVAAGKDAVTVVRKAIDDTEAQAKATVTTGRRSAARVADVVVKVVSDDAAQVGEVARAEAKLTRAAVRRTATTATNGAARTRATASTPRASRTTAAKGTPAKKSTTRATRKASPKSTTGA